MRLISIEHRDGLDTTVINTDQICSIFEEDGIVYLLYAVAGESGIGLARVDFE